ncbi:unnamed protein product [Cochlearia groenlandica]
MTSPPSPPLFDVSPATAATENFHELTIAGFLKSIDAFPLYVLIAFIIYIVIARHCNGRAKQKPKPLKKDVLKFIPKFILSSESCATMRSCRCLICLDDYVAGDVVRVLPQCGHEFHALCIDKWFRLGSTCPSCRTFPVAYSSSCAHIFNS